jgi:hypothetical protein
MRPRFTERNLNLISQSEHRLLRIVNVNRLVELFPRVRQNYGTEFWRVYEREILP